MAIFSPPNATPFQRLRTCSYWEVVLPKSYRNSSSSATTCRRYGPSPSDLRPTPGWTSNAGRDKPVSRGSSTGRSWRWPDAARSKLRESYASFKERGEIHPLNAWRTRDPSAAAAKMTTVAKRTRRHENEARLLQLLTGCLPRKLSKWVRSKDPRKQRYRISLFGHLFSFFPPGEPPGIVTWAPDTQLSVFVALSISADAPHPYATLRSHKNNSRLNTIGIRVLGKHPTTGVPFDVWARAGDTLLARILHVADGIEDQDELRKMCVVGLEKNLTGEPWRTVDVEQSQVLPSLPYEGNAKNGKLKL